MSKKILITATMQSHICQFHKPLMKMLKENGYEVYVAARDNLAEKNGLKMEYADKVYDIPFFRSPFNPKNIVAYKELKRIINGEDFAVIHSNTPVGGIVTRIVALKARKRGAKVFYTAHGFHFYKGAPFKNWLIFYPIEKFFSRFTDKLITITKEDYALAKAKFKCKVCYIHGVGANSSRYVPLSEDDKTAARARLGYSQDTKIIFNVGELLPNKNQKTAVMAMNKVTGSIPDSLLLIAGNGPEKENLERLIAENALEEKVKLLGYTMELPLYMAACDLLITCSYREGLPMNVLEAMLSGRAVVASDNRGHRELVKNGENGYLVQPDDYSGYAQRIVTLLSQLNSFADNSIRLAEPFKDINVVNELKEIYEI